MHRPQFRNGQPIPSERLSRRVKAGASSPPTSFRLVRSLSARLFGAAFVVRALFQESRKIDGIRIYGPPNFREAVAAALHRLASDAPDAFALCKRFVEAVVIARNSGVSSNRRPAIVLLGHWATQVSLPYLASTLVHEAYHCQLYWSSHESSSGKKVPAHLYSGEEAERACIEYQTSVLKQLGGSDAEAQHLRDQMATEWWKVPWHERTW
jgi:hypothetical protein